MTDEIDLEDVSVDFSVEELVALSIALELPVLPGLGDDPLGAFDESTRAVLLESARRSLVARRVVSIDDDGRASVHDAVATLLNIAASPGILARVQLEVEGRVETRFFAAVPDVSIEHAPLHGSVHRLTPFSTEELLLRILDFTALQERPPSEAKPFTVMLSSLEDCGTRLENGAIAEARTVLIDGGAPPDAAAAFVDALQTKVASARVAILHRPDETHLEGGELTWVDSGEHGLWLTPTPDASDPDEDEREGSAGEETEAFHRGSLPIQLELTTAEWIAKELLTYLPGADEPATG